MSNKASKNENLRSETADDQRKSNEDDLEYFLKRGKKMLKMEEETVEAIQANTAKIMLEMTRNQDSSSKLGTKNDPLVIYMPNNFTEVQKVVLLKSLAKVLTSLSVENGSIFVEIRQV